MCIRDRHAIAEAQKAGGVAAFIDAEHALDLTYAKKLGVQTDGSRFTVTLSIQFQAVGTVHGSCLLYTSEEPPEEQ